MVKYTLCYTFLMEIKGFSQCIAANKQQACGLAAAASCLWVFRMQISFAALSCSNLAALSCSNLAALSCSNLAALSCSNLAAHCLLQPCGLCVFQLQIRFLALSCSLFAANSCGLFAANSCSHLIFVSFYYKEWVLALFLLVTAASCNWLRVVSVSL